MMTRLSFTVSALLLATLVAPAAGAQTDALHAPTAEGDTTATRAPMASPSTEASDDPTAATEASGERSAGHELRAEGTSGSVSENVDGEAGGYTNEDGDRANADSAQQGERSDEETARAAFHQGDQLFLEGDYEGAVEAFQEAYAASGRIEMLFNLANAHERLGNYSEAAVALRGYIPHAPARQRAALERRLARFERRAKQAREAPPVPAPLERIAPRDTIPVQRAAGIGLIGFGVASLAVGAGFALSALDARSGLDGQCEEGEAGRLCPVTTEPLLTRDHSHSLVADVAFVAGALAGAVGVVLVLDSVDDGKEVHAGIGPSSAFLGGTF